MSDKLNKNFMADPAGFMRRYPVDIWPFAGAGAFSGEATLYKSPSAGGVAEGMADFDLAEDAQSGLVRLGLFAERAKATSKYSNPIPAYWLPWKPTGSADVAFAQLDLLGATFLFTSSLSGCRILITDTGFHHISGQLSQKLREKTSNELRGGQRARAFSSSTNNKYGNGAFIVGYRKAGTWRFVAQSSEPAEDDGRYVISRTWANNELYLIEDD